MNNSELEKAYDEYEKLLDEKNYLEQDLADQEKEKEMRLKKNSIK